jgi:hypothetical protein
MDQFSIPERLDPVTPAEPRRRRQFSEDQRGQKNQNPLPPKDDVEVEDMDKDESEDPEGPADDEDLHKVDELA